ncbi:MAG: taurine dioxygenase [Massilia sp.]|nr:taurine dioxygenase [Massilia sp.]
MPAAFPSVLPSQNFRIQPYAELQRRNPWRPNLTQAQIDEVVPAVHPVMRTHPETGRKALFVSEHFTTRIIGLPDDERRALLDELFDHSTRPGHIYHHQYQPGDMVFWDNRSLMHLAAGCPIGWAFAWPTLIAAELVFGTTSGQGGLGWYIFQSRNERYTDKVFAGLAAVIVIGVLVENLVFQSVERLTVRRWGMQRQGSGLLSGRGSGRGSGHGQDRPAAHRPRCPGRTAASRPWRWLARASLRRTATPPA